MINTFSFYTLFADHCKLFDLTANIIFCIDCLLCFIAKFWKRWVIKMQSTSSRPLLNQQQQHPAKGIHPFLPPITYIPDATRYTTTAVHSANFWRFPWLANQNQAHERTQKAFCFAAARQRQRENQHSLAHHHQLALHFAVWHTNTRFLIIRPDAEARGARVKICCHISINLLTCLHIGLASAKLRLAAES